jgi:hypothetical protein
MDSTLDQWLGQMSDSVSAGESDPELPIFSTKKGYIKTAYGFKRLAQHNRRGQANRINQKQVFHKISGAKRCVRDFISPRVLCFGCIWQRIPIDVDMNYIGMHRLYWRIGIKASHLLFELPGAPSVILIQKRH